MVFGHPQLLRQFGMLYQVMILTMHRDKELRTHEIVHELQFFAAGMTGYMNFLIPAINHVCP